jgi:hypothetical protein
MIVNTDQPPWGETLEIEEMARRKHPGGHSRDAKLIEANSVTGFDPVGAKREVFEIGMELL